MNWQSKATHSLLDIVIETFSSQVCVGVIKMLGALTYIHTQKNQTVLEIKILIGNYILLMSERLLRSK